MLTNAKRKVQYQNNNKRWRDSHIQRQRHRHEHDQLVRPATCQRCEEPCRPNAYRRKNGKPGCDAEVLWLCQDCYQLEKGMLQ